MVHGPLAWEEGAFGKRQGTKKRESNVKKLGMVLCSAFALWKAERINHKSCEKVLASHSSFNTVARDLSLSRYYNADRPSLESFICIYILENQLHAKL